MVGEIEARGQPRPGTIREMTSSEARKLPSVAAVLEALGVENGTHATAVDAVRAVLGEARVAIRGGGKAPGAATIIDSARSRMQENGRASFRRVINATGVILQTNLGRAPLSGRAVAAIHIRCGYRSRCSDRNVQRRVSIH